ncbi:Protein phnO [Actinoplanes sp. SE50]|uniref:GNAT family N-acetyltransferase n=1 Tax=unclassified Actinoplanes TaxID=2626549 RepID=UPI00023ECDEB|nr:MULTISPECIES: GNAT family N-acetyltransferase [unclassified Actinoplanes]AEV82099.1 Protein phnO [Actinoplanes sp. SE50/110]ATO80498.1 Protein phnO [Actinoplanes sp. SE50]SLL97905.1 Protein phnO [Actinoplanes sp. SE50/110]
MHIRPIHQGDAPRLAVLLEQLGYPSTEKDVRHRLGYWLDDRASHLLGADDDGVLAGVAALHVTPIIEVTGKFARLVAIVVDADSRHRGAGRALMAAAEQRARAAGCLFMEVTSDRERLPAHRFYESLGYTDTHESSRRFIRRLTPADPARSTTLD